MKKKLLFGGVAMLLAAAAVTGFSVCKQSDVSDLLNANVEALATGEQQGLMKYVCEYLGCCGGEKKCFTGSVSYGGASVSGTFYMD